MRVRFVALLAATSLGVAAPVVASAEPTNAARLSATFAVALGNESLAASAGPPALRSPARDSARSDSGAASDRTVRYIDAIGDHHEFAPDISQIVVSLIGKRLTFRVGIANLGPGLIDDEFVGVAINTDRNAATGCDGAEVALAALGNTDGAELARWGRCAAGSFRFGAPQESFSYSLSRGRGLEGPGAMSFALNADDLGETTFTFELGTVYEGIYDDYFDAAGPFAFAASLRPVITRHADVRAEATGPNGAKVAYTPAKVRGAKTVSYSQRSGTIFRLGRTTVTVTARNGARVARSAFVVTVADTTRPTFNPLPAVGTNATEPALATITYGPMTATDRVDRDVAVTCTPASGSVVAPGTTSVACTAWDDAGNTSATVFRVPVPVFASQMSLQTNTTYAYDSGRNLIGATTGLTVAVPLAADGSPTTYTWAASSGTISGRGPTASWVRQLNSAGQPATGNVTVTLTYETGRTEVLDIQFP